MRILNEGQYEIPAKWKTEFTCPICKLKAEIDADDLRCRHVRDELHGRDNSHWEFYLRCPNKSCRTKATFDLLPNLVESHIIRKYRDQQ